MLEFLTEFLGETLIELVLNPSENSKIPRWLAITLLVLVFGFYFIIGGYLLAGAIFTPNIDIWGRLVIGIIGAFLIIFPIFQVVKNYRKKSKK